MHREFRSVAAPGELEELLKEARDKPVLFFKHSVSCPISGDMLSEIHSLRDAAWLIVVQYARSASDLLAKRTGVRHESPQVLVVKDGKAVYSASHYDIDVRDISKTLKEYG